MPRISDATLTLGVFGLGCARVIAEGEDPSVFVALSLWEGGSVLVPPCVVSVLEGDPFSFVVVRGALLSSLRSVAL